VWESSGVVTIGFAMPGLAVEHPPDPSSPPRAFCRGCGYALIGLESRLCPECGRGFDPANPRTFAKRPPRPWFWRWGRRVLGMMLLLGISCGVGVEWLRRGWLSEQVTVAQLRNINAGITLKPIGPQSLEWLLGGRWGYWRNRVQGIEIYVHNTDQAQKLDLSSLRQVERFKFYSGDLSGHVMDRVAELSSLKELDLICATIDNRGLAALQRIPNLERLNLRGTHFPRDGLSRLANLKRLRVLNLQETFIADANVQSLGNLPNLEELDLSGTSVADQGLAKLSSLHSLRVLKLGYTQASASGIDKLKRAIPGLVVHSTRLGPQL